jgi:hypothetical protein
MTVLPRRMYKDPAEQLLEAAAETCKGCKSTWTKRGLAYCDNPLVKTILADKRCNEYEENV